MECSSEAAESRGKEWGSGEEGRGLQLPGCWSRREEGPAAEEKKKKTGKEKAKGGMEVAEEKESVERQHVKEG